MLKYIMQQERVIIQLLMYIDHGSVGNSLTMTSTCFKLFDSWIISIKILIILQPCFW